MKRKLFSTLNLYLFSVVIGFILIITGIITLLDSVKKQDSSLVWKSAIILFIWILFTIFNLILYKKERKKSDQ
jgi:uncharacterized membrane protein HdeD (DUF308 family)